MRFSFLLWKQDGIEALLAFLPSLAFISRVLVSFINSRDIIADSFYSSISQFLIYNAAILRALLRFHILESILLVSEPRFSEMALTGSINLGSVM